MRYRTIIPFCLLAGLFVLPDICHARSKALIKAEAALAEAWNVFYAGEYEKAYKMATAVSSVKIDTIKAESVHLQGRCAWAINTKKSQAAAVKLWSALPKFPEISANLARIDIDAALQSEAAQKLDEAAAKLEAVLRQQTSETSTAEAAIEYAYVCGLQKQWSKGHKALDFAIKFMQMQAKYGEISQVAAGPFIKAAQAMKLKLEAMKNHQPGKEEYQAAMKLFDAGKFKDAAIEFQKIAKQYPDSPYRYMSELAFGDCIAAVKGTNAAVKYWEDWIKAAPGGPWRGQAYLRVIDEYLTNRLDLNSARQYSNLAGANLKNANSNKEESWKEASFDIAFRCGMIECLLGNVAGASNWFNDCSKLTDDKSKQQEIGKFVELVKNKNKTSIIPADACDGKDPRVVVALKLAEMYRRAGQLEKSDILLSRLIGGTTGRKIKYLSKATSQQKSYAMFCRAKTLKTQAQNDDAEKFYKYSLQKFNKGSWQDESMWQLASAIKTRAELLKDKKLNPQPKPQPEKTESKKTDAKKSKSKPIENTQKQQSKKPLTLADLEKQEKLEDAAENTYANVLSAAGPYWEEIVKCYPKSEFAGPSLYELGSLEILKGKYKAAMFTMMKMLVEHPKTPQAPKGLYELGTAMLEAGLTKDGTYVLEELVKTYPKDRWAGNAYVALIDNTLEKQYDLEKAKKLAAMGISWIIKNAPSIDISKTNPTTMPVAVATTKDNKYQPQGDILRDAYEVYLRAGLVEYLQENYELATKYYSAGQPAVMEEGVQKHYERHKIGLYLVLNACNRKIPVWDPVALEYTNDVKQITAVKLADLYIHAQRPEKSIEIYEMLLDKKKPLGHLKPRFKGYCLMRLALAYSCDKQPIVLSESIYKQFYRTDLKDSPWAPDAIIRLGVLLYNDSQDPKKAMPHYKYVFTKFPNHPEARRALYFYALDAVQAKDHKLAKASCEYYFQKYNQPDDGWYQHLKKVMREDIPQLLKGNKK